MTSQCIKIYLFILLYFSRIAYISVLNEPATFVFNNETKNLNDYPAFFPTYQSEYISDTIFQANLNYLADSIISPCNYTVSFNIPRGAPYLTIGGIFDMTDATSGDLIPEGVLSAEAFKCAIVDSNANLSILPNTTLLYQIMNGGSLPSVALNAAYFLTNFNSVAIIGNF